MRRERGGGGEERRRGRAGEMERGAGGGANGTCYEHNSCYNYN